MTKIERNNTGQTNKDTLKNAEKNDDIDAIVIRIISRINEVLSSGDIEELKKVVLIAADYVDESGAMNKIRAIWEYVPPFIRWAIIHKPSSVLPDPFTETVKNLIFCGFLPYKEDPGMNEEYLKHKDHYDQQYAKWALKLLKIIMPELVILDKLMAPINQVLEKQAEFRIMIRHHLSGKQKSAREGGGRKPGDPGENVEPNDDNDFIRENPDLTEEDMIYPGPTYMPLRPPKKAGKTAHENDDDFITEAK